LPVKRDLGGCHTAAEFATQAYRDSKDVLGRKKRALRRMNELLGALKGAEIAGVLKLPNGTPAPWKEVLTTLARSSPSPVPTNQSAFCLRINQ
jgi:hypothetical protein